MTPGSLPRTGALDVLIVDDSPTARLLIAEAVLESGRRHGRDVRVSEAVNAFDALQKLPRGRFDLILTDINMPTISGLELIRMIRARPEHRDLPIVAISTERTADDVHRARRAGADGYLGKPFEPETLDRLLIEIFQQSGRAG